MNLSKVVVGLLAGLVFSPNLFAAANGPPDMAVTIEAPSEVEVGQEFVFQVKVENIGDDTGTASLSIQVPAAGSLVSVDSADASCDPLLGNEINCPLGTLFISTSKTVSMTWKAPDQETILQASAAADASGDTSLDNNSANAQVQVVVPPPPPNDPGNNNGGGNTGGGGAEVGGDGGCALGGLGAAGHPYAFLFMGISLLIGALFRLKPHS